MNLPPRLLALAAVLCTGCATDPVRMQTFTIAGGTKIELPMDKPGPPPAENQDLRIEATGFMLDEDRGEVLYAFAFTAKSAARPRAVRVDDVTGPTAEIMVIDAAPKFSPDGYWQATALPYQKGDASLAWITVDGDTLKVFRFRITTADGRELVLHQPAVWPGDAKPLLRQLLGYDGPARRTFDPNALLD